MKCISISVLQQQYFFYCYEALLGRLHLSEFWNLSFQILRRKPSLLQFQPIFVSFVTQFFCCPISLFKGYVTWQNFTPTGPVLSAYLLYKNTDRNDKVKYTQSAFSGKGPEVRAYCFPPLPPPCLVPFPPLILQGPTCLFPSTMNYGAV